MYLISPFKASLVLIPDGARAQTVIVIHISFREVYISVQILKKDFFFPFT